MKGVEQTPNQKDENIPLQENDGFTAIVDDLDNMEMVELPPELSREQSNLLLKTRRYQSRAEVFMKSNLNSEVMFLNKILIL